MRASGAGESRGRSLCVDCPTAWLLPLLLFGTPHQQQQLLCACSLRPSLQPPALAAPCVGLRHCSQLLSEANSCAHSCMPGSVSGCLGASVVLTSADSGSGPPRWAAFSGPCLLPTQQPLCALGMTTLRFQPLQGSTR